MGTNPDVRFKTLEDRLDRLAMRGVVAEVLFSTATAFIIGSLPQNLQRQIIGELRRCVFVRTEGTDAARIERVTLETEEIAAQLLDQIEGAASVIRARSDRASGSAC